jgi:glycerophosphoryl diester phosphodiesterase
MIVLAHRGLWTDPSKKNTMGAFAAAFAQNFGLETDIRDYNGRLVVSHDPPFGDAMSFEDLLALYVEHGRPGRLAINIKADGLSGLLDDALAAYGVANAFVFDMSVPDGLHYCKMARVQVFTRQSEYEAEPAFYDRAAGVWLDCFERDWIDSEVIGSHRMAGKQVALVSPELHGRSQDAQWRAWADFARDDGVMICTDFPIQARAALT